MIIKTASASSKMSSAATIVYLTPTITGSSARTMPLRLKSIFTITSGGFNHNARPSDHFVHLFPSIVNSFICFT
ncbi:hypothetical protein [Domibacillus iocasae]|uniref:hypothetical protein n=1 Tax=Domibacillus iocasae TaxID=1714016 RepID=UPI00114C8D27|nr:hypothetical protein [Domibacillus iocasae]